MPTIMTDTAVPTLTKLSFAIMKSDGKQRLQVHPYESNQNYK